MPCKLAATGAAPFSSPELHTSLYTGRADSTSDFANSAGLLTIKRMPVMCAEQTSIAATHALDSQCL